MDLLEIGVYLLEKGGAVAGLGGGVIATRVLGRVADGLKDAKNALARAKSALDEARKVQADHDRLRVEFDALRSGLASAGGFAGPFQSGPGLASDPTRFGERIAQLESRMSAVEDDFDAKAREDKQSWEAIQRAVGRIEGALQPPARRE